MRVTKDTTHADGTRSLTVRLKPGEGALITQNHTAFAIAPGVSMVSVDPNHHYRLGGQVDDVMSANVLTEAEPVYWDNFEQKWTAV